MIFVFIDLDEYDDEESPIYHRDIFQELLKMVEEKMLNFSDMASVKNRAIETLKSKGFDYPVNILVK